MTPTSDEQEDEALASAIENISKLMLEDHFSDGWNGHESDTSSEIRRNNSLLASLTLPQIVFFKTNKDWANFRTSPSGYRLSTNSKITTTTYEW